MPVDAPAPDSQAGLRALQALARHKHLLAPLEVFHRELGDVFRVSLPGFNPIVLVGPEANRFVFITARDTLRWRAESDPITRLLRQGLLVIDGEPHDRLRQTMSPAFHRRMLADYVAAMVRYTDEVSAGWKGDHLLDMLAEMRRVALLILTATMFGVDFSPEMGRLWPDVLAMLRYISPGLWLIWREMPRPGYAGAQRRLDAYLYGLIRRRREGQDTGNDLLSLLVATPGLSDDLIRDQLWTMLIAGHDTSTALLAWTLYLLGRYPAAQAQARAEVDAVLGGRPPDLAALAGLEYLDRVVNEALRLYPPVHLGLRTAAVDLEFQGYRLPAGTRVLYSPYLTHRDARTWPDPECFDPDRFTPEASRGRPAYSFVPFGGGPRICLGAAFAQVEAKVILARLLQQFELGLVRPGVGLHMGVTLEPHYKAYIRRRGNL